MERGEFIKRCCDFLNSEYFMILNKWAATFRDGHVNAILRSDLTDIEMYETNVRFELLAPGTDHETLIVSKAGPSYLNLKVGTVVSKIQGKNWTEYASDAEKFTSGSTLQMRRRQMANYIFRVLLASEGAKSVKIEGQYNGKPVSEIISRNLSLYDGAKAPVVPEETGINYIKSAILENNIGYLRLDAFGGTQMKNLLTQVMDRLADTSGLIIDLRKNGGGDLSGDVILSRLITAPIDRFHQRSIFSDYLKALRPSIVFDYHYKEGNFSEINSRKVKPYDVNNKYKTLS